MHPATVVVPGVTVVVVIAQGWEAIHAALQKLEGDRRRVQNPCLDRIFWWVALWFLQAVQCLVANLWRQTWRCSSQLCRTDIIHRGGAACRGGIAVFNIFDRDANAVGL